jgi:hypothetical protein
MTRKKLSITEQAKTRKMNTQGKIPEKTGTQQERTTRQHQQQHLQTMKIVIRIF